MPLRALLLSLLSCLHTRGFRHRQSILLLLYSLLSCTAAVEGQLAATISAAKVIGAAETLKDGGDRVFKIVLRRWTLFRTARCNFCPSSSSICSHRVLSQH